MASWFYFRTVKSKSILNLWWSSLSLGKVSIFLTQYSSISSYNSLSKSSSIKHLRIVLNSTNYSFRFFVSYPISSYLISSKCRLTAKTIKFLCLSCSRNPVCLIFEAIKKLVRVFKSISSRFWVRSKVRSCSLWRSLIDCKGACLIE